MNTKNIFGSSYRQDYLDGYSNGQNPMVQMDSKKCSLAYISGFNSGRMDYEEMNGDISKGIPQRFVTIKILLKRLQSLVENTIMQHTITSFLVFMACLSGR